jgi:hypothetical protein
MNAHIENLRKALNGELEKERLRQNQEAWRWIKQNDTTLEKMLRDAKQYTKNGDPMIRWVKLIF